MGKRKPLKKIKVVFDTNILISAWFWDGSESKLIELVEEGVLEGYTSPQLLSELRKALEYPKFKLQQNEIETIYDYYALVLKVVEPKHAVKIITENPEDNKVLECAIEAEANYIVSGNHHLLGLREFKGIRIVRVKELLEELTQ